MTTVRRKKEEEKCGGERGGVTRERVVENVRGYKNKYVAKGDRALRMVGRGRTFDSKENGSNKQLDCQIG